MAGRIRLFEKASDGKLFEVDPSQRGARRVARVNLDCDVLFTAEEEAQRDADEAADRAASDQATEQASMIADPVERLLSFLADNPDVATMIAARKTGRIP